MMDDETARQVLDNDYHESMTKALVLAQDIHEIFNAQKATAADRIYALGMAITAEAASINRDSMVFIDTVSDLAKMYCAMFKDDKEQAEFFSQRLNQRLKEDREKNAAKGQVSCANELSSRDHPEKRDMGY